MVHKAVVQMEPTNLELLDGFEQSETGHKYVIPDSNIQVIVSGRDWSEKRIFVYGSTSTDEAENYVLNVIDSVKDIGHSAELVSGPHITNIAVNGDLQTTIQLESLVTGLEDVDVEVEYEPEQFPAAIIRLGEFSATFLLFSTGSYTIQGLQDTENIEPVIDRIQSLLLNKQQM
jgi:TATA-box binding protein (TBP) (component of TFIID and TFIIIB)